MRTLLAEGQPLPYESIALDVTQSDIDRVMESYLAFLTIPESERLRVQFRDAGQPRTGRHGYVHKTATDTKHVFHMSQTLQEQWCVDRLTLPAEGRQFLAAAHELFDTLMPTIDRKYAELEDQIPGIRRMHFPRSGVLAHKLRFLAYEEDESNTLAQGHYDKGSGTVAIAESHGGLRLGYGQDDLIAPDRGRFDPIFFHSFGWHQIAEILDAVPTGRAAWHDVIDTGERVNDVIARWALVLFIDPAHLYLESTYAQTHTPIPWRGLGSQALRADGELFNL